MKVDADAFKAAVPGFGITLTIALISYLVSSLHMSFDTLTVAIIFGILVSNMFDDQGVIQRGADAALRMFLPLGIALYGLDMKVLSGDLELIAAIFLVVGLMFATTYFVSRGFGIKRHLGVLLSSGMSVCGSMAIAVLSPSLGAKREETSISVLSVITAGLVGMLIYRFLPDLLGIASDKIAFMAGTTLPMMGQVKVISSGVIGKGLASAVDLKLIRIPILAVIAASVVILNSIRSGRPQVPWYMAVFFVFAISVNLTAGFDPLRVILEPLSNIFLTIALAAVGLSIDFDSLTSNGMGPILAVMFSYSITVLTLYLIMTLVG